MQNITSITGRKGEFTPLFAASGSIPSSGSPGLMLTITPPAGQRVRLTNLSTDSGVFQGAMSVLFDAVTIIATKNIHGSAPFATSNSFSIGSYQEYGAGVPPSGNYKHWTGKKDEVLTLVKGTASNNNIIYYGYEFGE